jgi:uncharacterized protein YjbI with pentapeptide repeats
MRISDPILTDDLRSDELTDCIERALDADLDEDIEGFYFEDGFMGGHQAKRLEFHGCKFERCRFAPADIKYLYFVDALFVSCDFSNMRFHGAGFQRARFVDCRCTGADFSECVLSQVRFENCLMDYANLSMSKLTGVQFADCSCVQAAFDSLKLKDAALSGCRLNESEWLHTLLNGIDLRGNDLTAIRIDPADLRGAIISPEQALILAALLGVVIK